jgi:hypothetical protein
MQRFSRHYLYQYNLIPSPKSAPFDTTSTETPLFVSPIVLLWLACIWLQHLEVIYSALTRFMYASG